VLLQQAASGLSFNLALLALPTGHLLQAVQCSATAQNPDIEKRLPRAAALL
jgi:hypothetical protein